MRLTIAVLAGFLLDSIFGDPEGVWHPVIAIGKLISLMEKLLRRIFPSTPRGEKIAGVFLWGIVCSVSFLVPFGILWGLGKISPWLAFAAQVLFCYQIFARKCLADAGTQVQKALDISLEAGQKAVGRFVGRDTGALDETGVIKATVETIAENTTDGVVSPMIYLLIGGAPLGFLYKAVNTLDSMVGYHNERYEHFGWFSAKMDDAFNFFPARLSAVCMIAGAGLLQYDNRNALRIYRRDRTKHKSPNAGQTESVCAGALHIQLAGDASYFGKTVHKATLGDRNRPIGRLDIGRTSALMTTASVLALIFGIAVRAAVMAAMM